MAANTIFSYPSTANYWKIGKNGFHSNHLCKYIVTYLTYTQLIALHIKYSSNTLLTEEGILILSSPAQKLQLKQG